MHTKNEPIQQEVLDKFKEIFTTESVDLLFGQRRFTKPIQDLCLHTASSLSPEAVVRLFTNTTFLARLSSIDFVETFKRDLFSCGQSSRLISMYCNSAYCALVTNASFQRNVEKLVSLFGATHTMNLLVSHDVPSRLHDTRKFWNGFLCLASRVGISATLCLYGANNKFVGFYHDGDDNIRGHIHDLFEYVGNHNALKLLCKTSAFGKAYSARNGERFRETFIQHYDRDPDMAMEMFTLSPLVVCVTKSVSTDQFKFVSGMSGSTFTLLHKEGWNMARFTSHEDKLEEMGWPRKLALATYSRSQRVWPDMKAWNVLPQHELAECMLKNPSLVKVMFDDNNALCLQQSPLKINKTTFSNCVYMHRLAIHDNFTASQKAFMLHPKAEKYMAAYEHVLNYVDVGFMSVMNKIEDMTGGTIIRLAGTLWGRSRGAALTREDTFSKDFLDIIRGAMLSDDDDDDYGDGAVGAGQLRQRQRQRIE